MRAFRELTATAAPFSRINVDTDLIIPKQFLKTITRKGLGKFLFYDLRYLDNKSQQPIPNPEFILNKPEYREAKILLTGSNFGCGSSREHAVWALADFGFRVIIGSSFADIFNNNCLYNGILIIKLPAATVDNLQAQVQAAPHLRFTVNLPEDAIRVGNKEYKFALEPMHKHRLLHGLDEIALTLQRDEEINAFENRLQQQRPWQWQVDR